MERLWLLPWQCFSPTLAFGLLYPGSCHVMRQPMKRPTWPGTNSHKTNCWKKCDKPFVSKRIPLDNLSLESVLTTSIRRAQLLLLFYERRNRKEQSTLNIPQVPTKQIVGRNRINLCELKNLLCIC